MELCGLVDARAKVAAQREKDFAERIRNRRRKHGLPVTPAGKILPFLPAHWRNEVVRTAAVDAVAEVVLEDDAPVVKMQAARLQLAGRGLVEALAAHEDATVLRMPGSGQLRPEQRYFKALEGYEPLASVSPGGERQA